MTMTKAQAKKQADKMRNVNYNIDATNREAQADAEMIRETVAEAKRRGIPTAQVIRERQS